MSPPPRDWGTSMEEPSEPKSTAYESNRREHLRVPRTVSARLHVGVMSLRCHVVDLSMGGVRLRVQDGEACPAVGNVGLLELHLDAAWRHVRIRVVRCTFDEVAVRFHEVTEDLRRALEAEVAASVAAFRRPHIVVVDPSPDRRHRIAESLRTAGCESVEAATPLEAIDIVEKQHGAIRGMTVADSLTQTSADELCEYVARSNPEIRMRRIALGTRDVPITDDLEDDLTVPIAMVVTDDDTLDTALRDFATDIATDISAGIAPGSSTGVSTGSTAGAAAHGLSPRSVSPRR